MFEAAAIFVVTSSGSYSFAITWSDYGIVSSIAATIDSSGNLRIFVNGLFAGSDTGVGLTSSTSSLYINNYFSGIRPNVNPTSECLVIQKALTDEEIAKVYTELKEKVRVQGLAKRNFQYSASVEDDTTLVAAYDGTMINGVLKDITGNGNDSISNGRYSRTKSKFRTDALSFDAQSTGDDVGFNCGDNIDLTEFTISLWVRMRDITTNGRLVSIGSDGATVNETNYGMNIGTLLGKLRIRGDGFSLTRSDSYPVNEWCHVVLTFEGVAAGGKVYTYQDKDQELITTLTSFVNYSTPKTAIGVRQDLVYAANADIALVKIYSSAKDQAWVDADYDKGRTLLYHETFEDANVSLEPVTSGHLFDEWRVKSGSYKISDDGADKWLECVTAGMAYMPSYEAYGTWEFDLWKKDASHTVVIINHDKISSASNASNYNFIHRGTEEIDFRKEITAIIDGGATTYAAETKHTVRITRDGANLFKLYMDGVLIGSVTNSSYTTAKYFVLDFDAGDKITNIKHWDQVIDPT